MPLLRRQSRRRIKDYMQNACSPHTYTSLPLLSSPIGQGQFGGIDVLPAMPLQIRFVRHQSDGLFDRHTVKSVLGIDDGVMIQLAGRLRPYLTQFRILDGTRDILSDFFGLYYRCGKTNSYEENYEENRAENDAEEEPGSDSFGLEIGR